MNTQTFWMCYVEGGNSPKEIHYSEVSANNEAARLARKEQHRVFVLESKAWYEVAVAPVERHETEQ